MSNLLKVLEYNKIIETLSKCAATSLGRELCTNLEPSFSFDIVSSLLKETKEAVDVSIKYTAPSFASIHDIRLALKRAEISSVLSLQNVAINNGDSRLTEHYNELLENHIHSAQSVNKVIAALESQFNVSAAELMPEMWGKNTVLWEGILEQNGKNRQACTEQILLLKREIFNNRKNFGNKNIFSSDVTKASVFSEGF